MLRITLPDGSQKTFPSAITVQGVAESIGSGLAKSAIAAVVDDKLVDMAYEINQDAVIKILTGKDEQGLEVLRHSSAHLLAQAVKHLFPSAQVTIGPVIEEGFYYDFAFERSFTPEDLENIEQEMNKLVKANLSVERKELTREEAIQLFEKLGEHYKVEIIKGIPNGELLTAYQQGDFIDLCRGPHVPNTRFLKSFKLTKLAGAYWRGDSNNAMLQRIYGTAWANKNDLESYLKKIEEAKKRDHRELAKKMDLFHFQAEAPGMVFWHPNGWAIIQAMRTYLQRVLFRAGYQEINTPQLVDLSLWEKSGHLAKFSKEMFSVTTDNNTYAIKPMSCPCHIQVFNQQLRSYRELPIRYAEFGCCHRSEPSGTLHGLMRVRAMTQDDGHIFCTENQIQAEVLAFIDQLHAVYRDIGFSDVLYKLSTRPDERVGSDAVWDKAEHALAEALNAKGVAWEILPGEGAFYGPKIEFSLRDCLGRIWQCGTIQVDFSMPERLGAFYIAENGEKRTPVMLHRAIFGSLERFLGIVLEHYAGKLPLWLAPIQVVVMNITDRQLEFVSKLVENLQIHGIRVIADLRNEKIGFKIREHTIARIPYQVVVGDREIAQETLAVRTLAEGAEPINFTVEEFLSFLEKEIAQCGQGGGIKN